MPKLGKEASIGVEGEWGGGVGSQRPSSMKACKGPSGKGDKCLSGVRRASTVGASGVGSEIPSGVRRASMQGLREAVRMRDLLLSGELNT